MKKDMQIYVKTAYLYWYSLGELRILALRQVCRPARGSAVLGP